MLHTFTRRELYDLVWSEPMSKLAKRFKISDTGLAKVCKKAGIPRPPRGYWAKKQSGKNVGRQPMPPRGIGMSDIVEFGGSHSFYGRDREAEILNSNPQESVFEDNLDELTKQVKAKIKRVTVPRDMTKAHWQIRKLLDDDEVIRQEQLSSKYSFSWKVPVFDDPIEKRRLRILNALFLAFARFGAKPSISGNEARDLSVTINDTHVSFELDTTTQKAGKHAHNYISQRGNSKKLRLTAPKGYPSKGNYWCWEDTDDLSLEKQLSEIAVEIVICAERRHRDWSQHQYDWQVKRKSDLIEKLRKRKEEAERQERECQLQLEKERVDRLLGEATALRQAMDIRAYVKAIQELTKSGVGSASIEEVAKWSDWATAQADRIDPVLSGTFLEAIHERDGEEG